MVYWTFLFRAIEELRILGEFIGMTQMLFRDAKASVMVNGFQSPLFVIERGVC